MSANMGSGSPGNRGNRPALESVVAERRTKVLQLRIAGMPPGTIAQQLGIAEHLVHNDINRALKIRTEALKGAVDECRSMEVEKLEAMERAAWNVLHRKHYQVAASGKVARHPDTGEPLPDDGPTLQAITALLKIQERRARLLGLDMPVKSSVEVKTIDQSTVESDIARLFSQLVSSRPQQIDGYAEVQPMAIEGPGGPAPTGGAVENGVP